MIVLSVRQPHAAYVLLGIEHHLTLPSPTIRRRAQRLDAFDYAVWFLHAGGWDKLENRRPNLSDRHDVLLGWFELGPVMQGKVTHITVGRRMWFSAPIPFDMDGETIAGVDDPNMIETVRHAIVNGLRPEQHHLVSAGEQPEKPAADAHRFDPARRDGWAGD